MLTRSAFAQAAPSPSVGEALRNLASRSSLAFAGQVLTIERKGGTVEIMFSVDQPLLGSTRSTYILREWGGLWPPGQHRFNIGQRVLIFLLASSHAGFSTPVDGMNGIIPIVSTAAPGQVLLDVRRLAATVSRAQGQPLPGNSAAGIQLPEGLQIVSRWREPLRREPVLWPLPQPAQPPTLSTLMPQQVSGARDARP